jgi:hypothetical protein
VRAACGGAKLAAAPAIAARNQIAPASFIRLLTTVEATMLDQTARAEFQEKKETGFGGFIRTFDPDVPGYVFWPIIFGVGAIFGLVVLAGF